MSSSSPPPPPPPPWSSGGRARGGFLPWVDSRSPARAAIVDMLNLLADQTSQPWSALVALGPWSESQCIRGSTMMWVEIGELQTTSCAQSAAAPDFGRASRPEWARGQGREAEG
eukprot:2891933-Pyramimonas_sp.AAC.1